MVKRAHPVRSGLDLCSDMTLTQWIACQIMTRLVMQWLGVRRSLLMLHCQRHLAPNAPGTRYGLLVRLDFTSRLQPDHRSIRHADRDRKRRETCPGTQARPAYLHLPLWRGVSWQWRYLKSQARLSGLQGCACCHQRIKAGVVDMPDKITPEDPHDNCDPHAHECYSCEFGSDPPATTKQCRGCISKDSRPRWVAKAEYSNQAAAAIARAMRTPQDKQP